MAANIKTLKINVDSASKMISKLPSIDKISPIKEYNFKKRLDNMNGLLKKNMSMDSFFDSKNLIFKNKEKSQLLTNKLKKFSTIDMSNIKINKSYNILSSTNNKSSEQEKKPKNKTIKINVVQEKGNNWNRIKSKSENSKLKDERMISPKTMDSLLSPRAYKPNDEEIKSIMPKTTNNITGLLKRDINYQNDESKGNKIIFVKTKIKKLFHKRNLAISKEQLDNNFFKAGIVTNLWRKIGFLREKEMQINDIFNKIKLILDNIDYFKANYFNNGNFYAAFENMKNMNKAELNLTIEELCFILIEIVPKLLQKFFDELDRILYIKIPDIEQEMEKIPTSEKECLELNCAFLNTVSLYFTGCTGILKEILKRVEYFKFTDNEFLIIDNYLDLARFDINKINSMAEIYIDKMKNDEKIFEKIEVGLGIRKKKINHMGDILERTHKRYSQNFKDKIKLERINSSLNLKHDLFGLNEKRKKFILMKRTKNLDILNQPIVANLMKYFNDNIKSQIISQQVFERYKLKEREAQNVVVSKSD